MDLAALIGFLLAWALILGTIATGSGALVFVNIPSLVIVLGGALAVVMMRFSLGQFIGAIKTAMKAFLHKSENPEELISTVVELAGIARKEGLLALESQEINGVIVFARTRADTIVISEQLQKSGFKSQAINGDLPQAQREQTINNLKKGHFDI